MSALSPADLADIQQRTRNANAAGPGCLTLHSRVVEELCRGYAESEGYRSRFLAHPAGKRVVISHPQGLECTVTETETTIHYRVG